MLNIFNKYPTVSWIIALLFAVLYYLFFAQFGIDYYDTFYHINLYLSSSKDPMFFGSTIIGNLFYTVFGSELILFRVFAFLLIISMFILPYFFLRDKFFKYTPVFFILLVLIYAPTHHNYLSYDVFTIFFLTVFILLLFLYNKNSSYCLLITLSLVSAIVIAVRLPNLTILPFSFLAFLITFYNNKQKMFIHYTIYLFAVMVFYFLFVYLYYDNLVNFKEAFKAASLNKGESHTFMHLIKVYSKSVFIILIFIVFLLIVNHVYTKYSKLLSLLFFTVGYYFLVFEYQFSYRLGAFLHALTIFLILQLWFKDRSNIKKNLLFMILITFVFSFVSSLGSDTGMHKSSYIFLFLPIFLGYLEYKKFYYYLLSIMLVFSITQRIGKTYYDEPSIYCDTSFEMNGLKYVKTIPQKHEAINEIYKEINLLKDQGYEIDFFGVRSHIFVFLNNQSQNTYSSFFMNNLDKNEMQITKDLINKKSEQKHIIVFINSKNTPQRHGVEKLLLDYKYILVQSKYFYYYRHDE